MDQTTIDKGVSILQGKPVLVVPLFVETDDALLDLPRFAPTEAVRLHRSSLTTALPEVVQEYVARELLSPQKMNSQPNTMIATYLVVAALHVIFSDTEQARMLVKEADPIDHNVDIFSEDHDFSIARKAWICLHKVIQYRWEKWLNILSSVALRFTLVQLTHPVHEYAQVIIPYLTGGDTTDGGRDDDLSTAAKILQIKRYPSVLRMMKEAQEKYNPRPWAVICDNVTAECLVQDCFPIADMTLNNNLNEINLIANYDTTRAMQIGVDRLACRGDCLEDRIRKIKSSLLPYSCLCDRCRYEMAQHTENNNNNENERDDEPWMRGLNVQRKLRLGHGYMALGEWDKARRVYEKVKDETDDCWKAERADAWHALGAIELSRGNFLAAQRIWNSAKEVLSMPGTNEKPHAGLQLQWDKLDCYGYLARDHSATVKELPDFQEIAPNAFVSQVLSSELCDRVLQWANTGVWTQERHYAVPTCDVPVHRVEPLLAWFNEFMSSTMCSLLSRQFETSPNFWVHDGEFGSPHQIRASSTLPHGYSSIAFVVKYAAGEKSKSNHLPLHTDECTHSFVVALNDEYEGGGTYFLEQDKLIRLQKGEILSFRGDSVSHGGEALQSGTRLIVAAFLYHDDGNVAAAGKNAADMSRKRPSACSGGGSHASKEAKTSFSFNFEVKHV